MKKIKKLLFKPIQYFTDAATFFEIISWITINQKRNHNTKTIAILFRFSPWKSFIHEFLPEFETVIFTKGISKRKFFLKGLLKYLKYKNVVFIVWGYKDVDFPLIAEYSQKFKIPIYRMEDAFLRSINLGSTKERPISLVLDKSGMHFNSRQPSDLENLLSTYNFSEDEKLLDNARENIDRILNLKLSKYNHLPVIGTEILDKKLTKKILVIGQVEDDASITYGCNSSMDNYELLKIAILENPDSEIFFKPHPDVVQGYRKEKTDQTLIENLATIVDNISIHTAIEFSDHVYTITSGAGFEALLHGKKVTTLGCPFYSGWGLTDDRQKNIRRTRKLKIEELFAGAYILYPRYVSLAKKGEINLSSAVDELINLRISETS